MKYSIFVHGPRHLMPVTARTAAVYTLETAIAYRRLRNLPPREDWRKLHENCLYMAAKLCKEMKPLPA